MGRGGIAVDAAGTAVLHAYGAAVGACQMEQGKYILRIRKVYYELRKIHYRNTNWKYKGNDPTWILYDTE